LNEPVEQFVNEMVNLAKQVDHTEKDYISVLRAKKALAPDLRLVIQVGEPTALTINSLLEKATEAIDAIQARDRQWNRHTLVPSLYGYKQNFETFPNDRGHTNCRDRGRRSFANDHPQPSGHCTFKNISQQNRNPTFSKMLPNHKVNTQ